MGGKTRCGGVFKQREEEKPADEVDKVETEVWE